MSAAPENDCSAGTPPALRAVPCAISPLGLGSESILASNSLLPSDRQLRPLLDRQLRPSAERHPRLRRGVRAESNIAARLTEMNTVSDFCVSSAAAPTGKLTLAPAGARSADDLSYMGHSAFGHLLPATAAAAIRGPGASDTGWLSRVYYVLVVLTQIGCVARAGLASVPLALRWMGLAFEAVPIVTARRFCVTGAGLRVRVRSQYGDIQRQTALLGKRH